MPSSQSLAENELKRIEQRVSNRTKSEGAIKFTPATIARLNKLEAQLRVKAQGNPQLQQAFGETQNFFTELNKLSPTDRASKLQSIRQAAEDEFADYYTKQRDNLSEDFNTQIDRLNRDFKFADDDTISAFKTRIAGLDRDTVAALSDAFGSVVSRGLGASGAMKKMADEIIQQRKIAVDQVKDIRDRSLRGTQTNAADRKADLSTAFTRGNETIDQNEIFNVKLEEQRLQDRQSNILLQSNELTGQNQLAPRVVQNQSQNLNPVDPISARIAALTDNSNEASTPDGQALQARATQRRNERINRLNLSQNAR